MDIELVYHAMMDPLPRYQHEAVLARAFDSFRNAMEQGSLFHLQELRFRIYGVEFPDEDAFVHFDKAVLKDVEENELHELTNVEQLVKAALRAGMDRRIELAPRYRIALLQIVTDPDNAVTDAYTDDILIQIAVLGDVVYG